MRVCFIVKKIYIRLEDSVAVNRENNSQKQFLRGLGFKHEREMARKFIPSPLFSAGNTSSVTRQKGESQNECFKKKKARQIFQKTNISYPLIRTH